MLVATIVGTFTAHLVIPYLWILLCKESPQLAEHVDMYILCSNCYFVHHVYFLCLSFRASAHETDQFKMLLVYVFSTVDY